MMEAKYDFWCIAGKYNFRNYVMPRRKTYVLEEEFPGPVTSFDVLWHATTDLHVSQEIFTHRRRCLMIRPMDRCYKVRKISVRLVSRKIGHQKSSAQRDLITVGQNTRPRGQNARSVMRKRLGKKKSQHWTPHEGK